MNNEQYISQKAARAASAAAAIAQGAASGGLYGAAAGAVRSFLPEIGKGLVILFFAAILIPMLIFTTLPNIMFGYDSAADQGIIDFTKSAYDLDSLYQSLDLRTPSLIDRLVNAILPKFWNENGDALYDDYSVTSSLGNLNQYWIIAIGSVHYRQDLNTMDSDAINELLYDRLNYSAVLVDRMLGISIWDLEPDAFMDKLGFDQEQKDWAALIYSSLAEDQNVSYADSDGPGYYNTNYGDITFSDAATEVVYYNQTDSRWGNESYGKTGTIGTSGCGPTALAIAVASLTNNQVTPYDVAQWSVENGYRCEGNGSYHSLIPNGGRHYGLTVTGIGAGAKQLVGALQEGKLVIAIMSKGHFTSSGHFIVLRRVTAEGKILVADPVSVKRSSQEWELGIITNEASRRAGSGGPFWVLSA